MHLPILACENTLGPGAKKGGCFRRLQPTEHNFFYLAGSTARFLRCAKCDQVHVIIKRHGLTHQRRH